MFQNQISGGAPSGPGALRPWDPGALLQFPPMPWCLRPRNPGTLSRGTDALGPFASWKPPTSSSQGPLATIQEKINLPADRDSLPWQSLCWRFLGPV